MAPQLAPRDPQTGRVLARRYELRALLGSGGMGEVYEAADRQLDRTVAIKVLRPELAADRRFLTRFRREARTAARLAHPGIVAIHDIGQSDGRAYIVMEFVPGRTLGQIVAGDGPLAPAEAARIAAAAADALAHAHERGVVHRDVSPGNVMIRPEGDVKILDFGIARASRTASRSGSPSARGTLAYLAPEQARGEAADQRVDIFALGAVLHELVTGHPPDARSARVATSAVPAPLDAIVARCLAPEPTARFARAEELAAALRAAAPPDEIQAWTVPLVTAPIPPPARTAELPVAAPPSRRRRRGAAVDKPRPTGKRRPKGRVLWALALISTLLGAASVAGPALIRPSVVEPRLHDPPPVPSPRGFVAQTSCDGWLSTRADLAWSPGGRSDGYQIWRREPGGRAYTLVARIKDWRATSYRDTNLGVDVTYTYVIRAVHGPRLSRPTPPVAAPTPLLCLA